MQRDVPYCGRGDARNFEVSLSSIIYCQRNRLHSEWEFRIIQLHAFIGFYYKRFRCVNHYHFVSERYVKMAKISSTYHGRRPLSDVCIALKPRLDVSKCNCNLRCKQSRRFARLLRREISPTLLAEKYR